LFHVTNEPGLIHRVEERPDVGIQYQFTRRLMIAVENASGASRVSASGASRVSVQRIARERPAHRA